jgi:ribosomal protein L7/L12
MDLDAAFEHIVDAGRARFEAGESVESVIRFLRQEGLWLPKSIKAVRRIAGVSLAEAKELVHFSETWADQRASSDALHKELREALGEVLDASEEQLRQWNAATDPGSPESGSTHQPG